MRHEAATANSPACNGVARYHRRTPERTLLFDVVATELDALRAALAAASPYGSGLPRHVDKELEAYLRCGILAHGFARVVCDGCRAGHLVAFSCKGRGLCPSCTTRRMHDTAAHLVDRVLPRVPVRQWVATFPRQVRFHLAADPKLATLALREVTRVIFAFQRRAARLLGARPARAHSNGAITMVQRFNSALELSLHFHLLVPDGVFVDAAGDRPRFIELMPPTDAEVQTLLDQIVVRVTRLLRRHGRLDHDEPADEPPAPHLLHAAQPAPGRGGTFVDVPLPARCARQDGYSLHAGTAIHENDRLGLERLARYCLRPPLALDRLSRAPDGAILYQMKRRYSDGREVLRFAPRELLLRLCALVPPRGFHMIRYHGIFAAHARGRHALTGRGMQDPRPTDAPAPTVETTPRPRADTPPPAAARTTGSASLTTDTRCSSEHAGGAALAIDERGAPDYPRRARRLDWAALLRRVYAVNVLVCAKCEGPMRIVAFVQDEQAACRILLHLGLPARAPPRGRSVHRDSEPADSSADDSVGDPGEADDWPDDGSAFDGVDPPDDGRAFDGVDPPPAD